MKKILILLLMLLISGQTVFAAQKTPIKIVPAENISTCYDEIQTGDKLLFQVKNDVYVDKQLIFKKGANVIGYVNFFCENGWGYDNAEITLNKFQLRNNEGKIVTINSEVTINGFEMLKTKGARFAQFFNYIGVVFRGKEIDIKHGVDNPEFVIWYY